MPRQLLHTSLAVIVLLLSLAALPARAADTGGLVAALVSQLGVTPEQAAGGAGALLSQAKTSMAPGDWTEVAAAIPSVGTLLRAAPPAAAPASSTGMGGMLGQAGAMLGSAQGLAMLAPAFQSLGLDPTMVSQFAPVILGYVESEAGQQTMALLSSAFTGMM